MMRQKTDLWLVLATLLTVLGSAGFVWSHYDRIQEDDERVTAEWSHVLNMYRRRADLVPNLLGVVKAYSAHEKSLLEEITQARASLDKAVPDSRDPNALRHFQSVQERLGSNLSRLLLVAENYPELKANGLFQDLMVQLEGSENRISYSRSRFIGAVVEYNLDIRRFPGNLVAKTFGYRVRPTFSVDNEREISAPPRTDLK